MTTIQSPEPQTVDSFVVPGVTGPGTLLDRDTANIALNLTTAVATAALQWPALNTALSPSGNAPYVWLAFQASEDFYVIWGDASVPAPLIASHTASNPTQTPRRVPANFEYQRKVLSGTYFRLIQASGADLLVYIEQISRPEFDL